MENTIGKQIRAFRLRKSLTQERLSELIGVTAQAVSKWENDISCPDISLLPEISAVLGVTLDELFDVSGELHLRRIEEMLENGPDLTEEDFRYADERLREGAKSEKTRGRCLTMLAELYNLRAELFNNRAAECAKQALELEPAVKDTHSALNKAMNGALVDWCCTNRTALIDYYKDFTAKNPGYAAGYLWLLDNLIADGRLNEAREYLEKLRSVRVSYHIPLYEGYILEREGNLPDARRKYDEMVEAYPDVWFAWSSRADTHAWRAEYDKAIADYREAARLQTAPRFTDVWDSIAQISCITGDIDGAIDAYGHVLAILRDDWGMTEGETVNWYEENIRRLRSEK